MYVVYFLLKVPPDSADVFIVLGLYHLNLHILLLLKLPHGLFLERRLLKEFALVETLLVPQFLSIGSELPMGDLELPRLQLESLELANDAGLFGLLATDVAVVGVSIEQFRALGGCIVPPVHLTNI